MKRFARIVLHVGADKTGSTAIQTACDHGRAALESVGVLYPLRGWHAQLGSYFSDSPEHYIYNVLTDRTCASSRASEDAEYVAELEHALKSSACDTLLLSYEGFASLDLGGLAKMADWLRGWSNRVDVLAYCREPLSYALSAASQRVRSGMHPWEPVPICPYADYFDAIRRAFGSASLSVHSFDQEALVDGDVVSDMARFVGLDSGTTTLLRSLGQSARHSAMLSDLAMAVGQRLAARYFPPIPVAAAFNSRFSAALSLLKGSKPSIPEHLRAAIIAGSSEHMSYLQRHFGIEFGTTQVEACSKCQEPSSEVVDVVTDLIFGLTAREMGPAQRNFDGDVRIVSAKLLPSHTILFGSLVSAELEVDISRRLQGLVVGLHIHSADGRLVYGSNTHMLNYGSITADPGRYTSHYQFLADLDTGFYSIGFGFSIQEAGIWRDVCWSNDTLKFQVRYSSSGSCVGSRDIVAAISFLQVAPSGSIDTAEQKPCK